MRSKSVESKLAALDEECRRLEPSVDGDTEELRESIAELRAADMPLRVKEQFLRLFTSLVSMSRCQREFGRMAAEMGEIVERLDVTEKNESRLRRKRKTK